MQESVVSRARESRLDFHRTGGKVHAKSVQGRFNRWRWGMVWFTQIIFYGACWLQWPGADGMRQAVWFDIVHEKFYLFGLVLWPQDALLAAFALIFAAAGLFLVTALAGRLFCGFACPQTVYTSIFTWIEARVEGDHLARIKLDSQPMNARKFALKATKHGLWALVAGWTAISFVGYFTPIRELLPALAQPAVGPWESFWLIFYGCFTYVQAGLAREAVCQHMCPYSRFQGVMFDPHTRVVSYDTARGEPRSLRRQKQDGFAGDCVDCGICVQVCPTGIDIRDGLQYQCINCGLCIDACDQVMQRIAAPSGLIRFAPEAASPGAQRKALLARPRVATYLAVLAIVTGLGAWTLHQRKPLLADILRDRGALSRETADGNIENAYTVKLMNLSDERRDFVIEVTGLPGIQIVGDNEFSVAAGAIVPISLTLATPADSRQTGSRTVDFNIHTRQDPSTRIVERSRFILP